MTRHLCFASLLFAACGTDTAEPAPDAEFQPPVACGTPLPGPEFVGLESAPNYANELAALDLSQVADPYDFGSEIGFVRGLINYMLGRESGTSFTRAEADAAGVMGRAVLGAIAQARGASIDVGFLRRGLSYAYPCTTALPSSLSDLMVRFGDYSTWPLVSIDCAPPKATARTVRSNYAEGVYVAETLLDDLGAGPPVRETEVIFTKLRGDGNLDFAAYTSEGWLTDRSTFVTTSGRDIVSAAPFTCMTCHADTESWQFSIQQPFGTGAGCQ